MSYSNSFDFNRFWRLWKSYWLLNFKSWLIGLSIFIVVLTMALLVLTPASPFVKTIKGIEYTVLKTTSMGGMKTQVFSFGWMMSLIISVSISFKLLKSKTSTINYLTVPASPLEKYALEIGLIWFSALVYPLLFYVSFDLYGWVSLIQNDEVDKVIHLNNTLKWPDFQNRADLQFFSALSLQNATIVLLPHLLLVGIVSFTNQRLIKSAAAVLLLIGLIISIYTLASYLLEISYYELPYKNPFSANSINLWKITLPLTLFFTGILIVISYFKLKEREV